MSDSIKPRCAKCQDWRMTKNEEAVTIVNGTALCSWHAKEGERDAASLRTALTASRREVELLRGVYKRECEKNGTGVLVAENATLRQEVERLKVKLANKHLNVSLNAEWAAEVDALRRQVEEQAASLGKVTRSWEEQAAKLAEQDGRIDRLCESGEKDRMDLITERNARMIAESTLAAAQERIKELSNLSPFIKQIQRVEAERDAALSRAEALEKALERTFHIMDDNYKWVSPDEEQGRVFRKIVEDGLPAFLAAALAAPSEPKEGA
jgi:hypothetical protein